MSDEITVNGITVKAPGQKTLAAMRLTDQAWRLDNLYHIVNEQGKLVQFVMRPAQRRFLKQIWAKNIILKARQLGFSSFIQIFMLDCSLFVENTACVVIAHRQDDAQTLIDTKVGVPYANLHPEIQKRIPITAKNKSLVEFDNGSSIKVTVSGRSGTARILHVSEMGYIAKHRPDIAKEIVLGSFPAIHKGGFIFVESTADGSSGLFYEMTTKHLDAQRQGKPLTEESFRVHFFPWFEEEEYRLNDADTELVVLPDRINKYFAELEQKLALTFDDNQKAWYSLKEDFYEDKMKQEYPSTPEEAFAASSEGQYFARQMLEARESGRVVETLPVPSGTPVYTYWDIGVDDPAACWFVSHAGGAFFNVVGYYEYSDAGMDHHIPAVKKIAADQGWILADTWYGPHDMRARSKGQAITLQKECLKYGAKFEVVPRVRDKNLSIQAARRIMASCRFASGGPNMGRVDKDFPGGLARLDNYRRKWNKQAGVWDDKPMHDVNSNGADAFQCFAMAVTSLEMKAERRSRAQADPRLQLPSGDGTQPTTGTKSHRKNSLKGYTV